jgi:hypothetical protein
MVKEQAVWLCFVPLYAEDDLLYAATATVMVAIARDRMCGPRPRGRPRRF